MGYQDKTLVCVECGDKFTRETGEQEYFAEKGYTELPKHEARSDLFGPHGLSAEAGARAPAEAAPPRSGRG